jgi:hypothetical protein
MDLNDLPDFDPKSMYEALPALQDKYGSFENYLAAFQSTLPSDPQQTQQLQDQVAQQQAASAPLSVGDIASGVGRTALASGADVLAGLGDISQNNLGFGGDFANSMGQSADSLRANAPQNFQAQVESPDASFWDHPVVDTLNAAAGAAPFLLPHAAGVALAPFTGGASEGAALGVTGAAMAAASAHTVKQQVMKLPEDQIVNAPGYQQAYWNLPDDMDDLARRAQARQDFAEGVSNKAAILGGGAAMAAGPLTETILGPILGALPEKVLPQVLGKVAAGAIEGGNTMAAQTMGENTARQAYDPSIPITQGAGTAFGQGAAFGGIAEGLKSPWTAGDIHADIADKNAFRNDLVDRMGQDFEDKAQQGDIQGAADAMTQKILALSGTHPALALPQGDPVPTDGGDRMPLPQTDGGDRSLLPTPIMLSDGRGVPMLPAGQDFDLVPDTMRNDRLPVRLADSPAMPAPVGGDALTTGDINAAPTGNVPPTVQDAIPEYSQALGLETQPDDRINSGVGGTAPESSSRFADKQSIADDVESRLASGGPGVANDIIRALDANPERGRAESGQDVGTGAGQPDGIGGNAPELGDGLGGGPDAGSVAPAGDVSQNSKDVSQIPDGVNVRADGTPYTKNSINLQVAGRIKRGQNVEAVPLDESGKRWGWREVKDEAPDVGSPKARAAVEQELASVQPQGYDAMRERAEQLIDSGKHNVDTVYDVLAGMEEKTPDNVVGLGNEKGVTAKGFTDRQLQNSSDWEAAKAGDQEAADRVIRSTWTDDKTKALTDKLDPNKETLFVSVPSTTGKNELPNALGKHLAQELGGTFSDGRDHFDPEHEAPIKTITPQDRPFAIRKYAPTDVQALKRDSQGKNVVVTEDVFTTGASAKAFVRALNEAGIHVDTVAGLMGDARLDAEPQVVSKLQTALKLAQIPIRAKDLAKVLSKGEVNVILDQLRQTRGPDAKSELARNLQGLLDERTPDVLGSVLSGKGARGSEREAAGDERPSSGIPNSPGIQERGQVERPEESAPGITHERQDRLTEDDIRNARADRGTEASDRPQTRRGEDSDQGPDRGQGRSAEPATEQTLLDSSAPASPPADKAEIGMKFGEEIGGSRYDRAQSRLTTSDLADMTDREREAYTVKNNIWPPIKYDKMVEDGVPAHVALLVKGIRDAIPAAPQRLRLKDAREAQEIYIRSIERVRDILSSVKTADDIRSLFDRVFTQAEYDKSRPSLDRWSAEGKEMVTELGGNKFVRKLQVSNYDFVHAQRKVEISGWPQKQVRGESEGSPVERYKRPMLDNVQRTGVDYREGRDVTPFEFKDTFGFRGGEFGKWLNQSDRQDSLNHAYDALMDLSQALNVPPKALSLDGALGFAFGARGGGHASAHYEPVKVAMNLTKTRGAGALAHEWFHAMDDHFGRLSGDRNKGRPYASHGQFFNDWSRETKDWVQTSKMRPEMVQAWGDVISALERTSGGPRTDFSRSAQQLGDYWARPHEKAARAFESYIQDRIENPDLDRTSQYLVHSTHSDIPGVYPEGPEREAINAAFDKFFDTVKTKETDKGVIMYRRPGETASTPGLSLSDAQAALDHSGLSRIAEVHESLDTMPQDVQGAVRGTGGEQAPSFYQNGKLYFNLENTKSPDDFAQSIAHEIIHPGEEAYGRRLGMQMGVREAQISLNNIKDRIFRDYRPEIDRLLNNHGYSQDYDISTPQGRRGIVSELLATKNETIAPRWYDKVSALVARIVNGVREKLGMGPMKYTEPEMRELIGGMRDAFAEEQGVASGVPGVEQAPAYRRAAQVEGPTIQQEPTNRRYTQKDLEDEGIIDVNRPKTSAGWATKDDLKKPSILTDASLREDAAERAYQLMVDKYAPIINRAKAVDKANGTGTDFADHVTEHLSRLDGTNGMYDRQTTGTGLADVGNPDREASTQTIPGTKSLREASEPISSNPRTYALAKEIGSHERDLSIWNNRHMTPEEHTARLADLQGMLADAQASGNREAIKACKDAISDQKDLFKGANPPGIDPEYSRQRLDFLNKLPGADSAHEFLDNLRQFNHDAILKPLTDAGIISKDRYDKIMASPEHASYLPFQRVMDDLERSQALGSGGDIIKALKGSERLKADPMAATMANLQRALKAINQNRVVSDLVGMREHLPDLNNVFKEVQVDPARARASDYLTQFVDGKKKYFDVPERYRQAINGLSPSDSNFLVKFLRPFAKAFRYAATLSPEFMVRHLIRSQWLAYIHSENGYVLGLDFLRAAFKMNPQDVDFNQWKAAGGGGSFFHTLDLDSKTNEADKFLGIHQKGVMDWVKTPIEMMEKLATYMDQGTRFGEYLKARQNGKDPVAAAYAGKDAALNFARAGLYGREINKVAAFWNANMQDMDKMIRTMRTRPGETLLKTALSLTLPAVALATLQRNSQVYQGLSDMEKNLFMNVVLNDDPKNPVVLRLPYPFQLGILAGAVPARAVDYMNTGDLKGLTSSLWTIGEKSFPFGTSILPTAAKAPLEAWANKSFLTGRPIENAGDEKLAPGYRGNQYTNPALNKLGPVVGISPKMMQNFVNTGLPNTGRIIMDALGGATRALAGGPAAPTEHFADMMGVRSLFTSGASSVDTDRFHDNFSQAEQAYNTFQALNRQGDRQGAQDWLNDHRAEAGSWKMMQTASQMLTKLHQQQAAIMQSTSMNADDKRSRLDDIRDREIRIAKQANRAFEARVQ